MEEINLEAYKDALNDGVKKSRMIQEDASNNIAFNYNLGFEFGIRYALSIVDGYVHNSITK